MFSGGRAEEQTGTKENDMNLDLKIFVMQNWNLDTAEIQKRAADKFGAGPVEVLDIIKGLMVVR